MLPRLMAVLQTAAFLFRHGAKLATRIGGLAFPAGLEPAYLRVRSAPLIQLSYGKMNMALPAGLEPASTAREAGILAARRWRLSIFSDRNGSRFRFGGPSQARDRKWWIGSRRTIRTCLPPLTAERLHRDGSTGMRWWSNGESNSGRRSCKDQLQPAACPEMVPSARFELASCALQARAITRFANWARWCGRQ